MEKIAKSYYDNIPRIKKNVEDSREYERKNIERFHRYKKFIFESTFIERQKVDPAIVEKIRNDEIELLKFGIKWLKDLLFNYKNFEVNPENNAVSVKDN